MNKTIQIIILFFGFCNVSFGQFKIFDYTENYIDVVYYNDSSRQAYFINPGFYLDQKIKRHKVTYTLRRDMYAHVNDTLYVYLTDTTRSPMNSFYQLMDSVKLSSGITLFDSMPPSYLEAFRIHFKHKTKYRKLVVRYNFSFRREDFFDKRGIPVKEIEIQN